MSNALLTRSEITKETLMQLKNVLVIGKKVNRQYDDKFAVDGAPVGSVINIRKPSKYEVTDGAVLNLQDTAQQYTPLTVDKQKHVGLHFSSKDMTLSMDEFSERIIQPAVTALANQVDSDLYALYKSVHNSVGVPGVTPATLLPYLQAKQRLAEAGAPGGLKNLIINPAAEAVIINALQGLFNPSGAIAKQYLDGEMGRAIGADWYMAQNVRSHTVGALGGTPLVDGASQSGASLLTKGWTAAAAARLKEGDVIQLAGVYSVNPQTRQSTGVLQNFVVTADFSSDASGNGSVGIYPSIVTSGALQTVTASPADAAAITIFGHASSYAGLVSPANMMFHKNAFALACVDMEQPDGAVWCERASDPDSGLSIRIIKQYDINNDKNITRLDILYGVKCIYPELACRIQG